MILDFLKESKDRGLDIDMQPDGMAFIIPEVGLFYILEDKPQVFGPDFILNVDVNEKNYADMIGADFYAYEFGGRLYYDKRSDVSKPKLNQLRHLGRSTYFSATTYLGVHGGYELCNGSRAYSDWVRKAKFLGISRLGICEKNTLAGAISFQMECNKNDIAPIIGMSVTVDLGHSEMHDVKLYVKDYLGWRNLLRICKRLNIDGIAGRIEVDHLVNHLDGLVIVCGAEMPLEAINTLKGYSEDTFVQISTVQYNSNSKDKQYLEAVKSYIESDCSARPILISDAYYLDKDDYEIKKKLNGIGSVHSYGSKNEYFKSLEEDYSLWLDLFNDDDDRAHSLFSEMLSNLESVGERCQYNIELGKLHLPEYELTDEEKAKYKTNIDLFWAIIEKRLETLELANDYRTGKPKTINDYLDRVELEYDVISRGGFIDYFLILWDINNWCNKEGILTGIGRGSAGGSLIAYLLGITKVDPLKYGLLFERFLNESRIKNSLPDIDTDFEGRRREEVKQYMIDRYGADYVCSVGTYTTFGIKGAIKDLARQFSLEFGTVNYMTSALQLEKESFVEMFKSAQQRDRVREFVYKNPELFNLIPLCLGQAKTASIHACATLIVPKKDKDGNAVTIFDWLPMRKTEDGQLISEWEGGYTEAAGFLKEDILGIRQLDKFRAILDLIKDTIGEEVDLESVPLDNSDVYEYFQEGLSEDVFHFGTQGSMGLSKELKPESIHELIDMIALHRPGAMNTGSHTKYVKCKFGRSVPEFDFGLEEVTKSTYGLYIYQEQVMRAVRDLGDFSLVDADGVRRAMGKKIKSKMDGYKKQFMKSALKKGCDEVEAINIWNKLEVFSGYGFNKSHAAAYAITGYICNWLKVNFPTQFWTVAFDFAKDYEIPRYISEIAKSKNPIRIAPPDINNSHEKFTADFKNNILYWSFGHIKQCGANTAKALIEEREKNGKFFDFEEVFDRLPKAQVKKDVFVNLILAGSFDEMYNINQENGQCKKRLKIIEEFYALRNEELPDLYKNKQEWWWRLQQKLISGLSHFDYRKLVQASKLKDKEKQYVDATELMLLSVNANSRKRPRRVVAGIVTSVEERNSKNGKFANVLLDHNSDTIPVTFWAGEWSAARPHIIQAKNCILVVEGNVQFDTYKYKTNIINTDSKSEYQLF